MLLAILSVSTKNDHQCPTSGRTRRNETSSRKERIADAGRDGGCVVGDCREGFS